jgi:hypothetical protein
MGRVVTSLLVIGTVFLGGALLTAHGARRAEPTIVSLSLVPGGQSIAVGDVLRLALVARYSDGSVRNLAASARWTTTNAARVRVAGAGVLRARKTGSVAITATVGARRAGTTVRVGRRSLGPLRVSRENPRYFVDAAGRVVYLSGAHTWGNLVDNGTTDPPPKFDFMRFLALLQARELRLFRLWAWEQATTSGELRGPYYFSPSAYLRTGPGRALDGEPRFDLTKFNPAYFARVRARVRAARERGIYVIVMLFDGWSVERKGEGDNPWEGHPFNRSNNINGVDGDLDRDGSGAETHSLKSPRITRLQEAYIARVVQAVGDQPNVLYEISNESSSPSLAWQNHLVRFIHGLEPAGRRHPVGITAEYPGGDNDELLSSEADWISPNGDIFDLTPSTGKKVVVADTDHLCGVCGHNVFPWQAFTRGLNPLLMDPYDGKAIGLGAGDADFREPRWDELRRRLGLTHALAQRLDMAHLAPRSDLASTGYCLADTREGALYVVYAPKGGTIEIDLTRARRPLQVEWIDPDSGASTRGVTVQPGAARTIRPPGDGEAVAVLRARG